jgi:hypothetical protein
LPRIAAGVEISKRAGSRFDSVCHVCQVYGRIVVTVKQSDGDVSPRSGKKTAIREPEARASVERRGFTPAPRSPYTLLESHVWER